MNTKTFGRLPATILACWIAAIAACSDHRTPLSPDAVLFGIGNQPQPAPSNLTAIASPPQQIDVRWVDNSSNEAGFEVHDSSTPNGVFSMHGEVGPDITATSFSGMGYSVTVCYKARAFTNVGRRKRAYSTFSNTECATTPPSPPQQPTEAAARSPGSTVVELSWRDNSSDELGFRIERSPSSSCAASWEVAGNVAANVTSFTDPGRTPEQWLCYRVIAFKTAGSESPPSPSSTVVPLAPPSMLAGQAPDHRWVELSWMDNSLAEERYEVHRALSAGGPFELIASLWGGTVAFTDRSVAGNTTYWYRVRATRGSGTSDFSTDISVTTPPQPPPSPPLAPSGVYVWVNSSTAVSVSWLDNSWNETDFHIDVTLDDGASWTRVGSAPPDSYESWVGGGTAERRNCYRVVAANGLGESPSSEMACAILVAGPTDATVRSDGQFQWKDQSAFEDGYEVWYCGPEECAPIAYGLPPNTETYLDPWYYSGFDYYIVAFKDGAYSDFVSVMRLDAASAASVTKTKSIRTFLDRAARARNMKRPR